MIKAVESYGYSTTGVTVVNAITVDTPVRFADGNESNMPFRQQSRRWKFAIKPAISWKWEES